MGVEAQNAVSGRRPNSGLSYEINNDGRPRLVSMDWLKSKPRPKWTCPLGWGVCLFVTYRRPNRLIKWARMDGGLDPRTDTGCVCPAPLDGHISNGQNAVFSPKGAGFGHET